jgi:hypothetical protein
MSRRYMIFELEYDMLGNRLRKIGAAQIDYDKLGNRARRMGRFTVEYDKLGVRPRRLDTDDSVALNQEELVLVFFVLRMARLAMER